MPSNPKSTLLRVLPTAHRLLVERFVRKQLPDLTGRVLVVGAGHDPYRQFLLSADEIVTSDVSNDDGELDMVADIHNLPFDDESFDAIVALEVFEHLHNPVLAESEVRRVLTQRGVGLVSIPFLFRVHGDPMDFTRFTRNGLETLFKSFSEVQITELGTRVHVISDIITTASKLLTPLRVINHLLVAVSGRGSKDCPSGYWIRLRK
jgi:SAM-dependent methyltransferase